ncbi:uncharacterized protein LOC116175111 isoform X2 [Photinus pyralis]|uniref:uncharacterized protein LOC116175111 isoform X2 n=1 Tax=Photinus pyralis TaxID=7054 RepID=UPI001267416B|nr:uncharacterized protein LOC116175111 isoform X2 [Photinus pyralis]
MGFNIPQEHKLFVPGVCIANIMLGNNAIKYFVVAAGSLGIVQGVTWIVLSLLALLVHFETWIPAPNRSTHGGSLGYAIIWGYLTGYPSASIALGGKVFIRPQEFHIWVILFMGIAVFWAVLSLCVIIAIFRKVNPRKLFLAWSIWTIVVCAADLTLVLLLSIDYTILVDIFNEKKDKHPFQIYELLSCGVLILLASRGIVLWFVNVIFAAIMFTLRVKVHTDFETFSNCSTNADSGHRSTRDSRRRSNKTHRAESFSRFQGLPRIVPIQSTNENVAFHSRRALFQYDRRPPSSTCGPPRPVYT